MIGVFMGLLLSAWASSLAGGGVRGVIPWAALRYRGCGIRACSSGWMAERRGAGHTGVVTRDRTGRAGVDPTRPRVPPVLGDVIAGIVIIASAFIPFPGAGFRPADPLTLALVVAPALMVPLRRRWPIPVLGAFVAFYA